MFEILGVIIDYYLELSIVIWNYRFLFGIIDYYLELSIVIWNYRLLFGIIDCYSECNKHSKDVSDRQCDLNDVNQ